MAQKKSIYISHRMADVLGNVGDEGLYSLSGRLNSIVDRYGTIIEEMQATLLASLSDDEKTMIKMVQWTTETTASPARVLVGSIAHNLVDSQDFELAVFPRESVEALIKKACGWSAAEGLALVEWVESEKNGA